MSELIPMNSDSPFNDDGEEAVVKILGHVGADVVLATREIMRQLRL